MSGETINGGGPAFPMSSAIFRAGCDAFESLPESAKRNEAAEKFAETATGMTLRDYFAGKALSAETTGSPDSRAKWAYEVADAMLIARQS